MLAAPLGQILLAAMAVALMRYAAWRIVEGGVDPDARASEVKALKRMRAPGL